MITVDVLRTIRKTRLLENELSCKIYYHLINVCSLCKNSAKSTRLREVYYICPHFLTIGSPKSTDSDRKFEKISYREEYEYRERTMVQINQEYRLKYWATR